MRPLLLKMVAFGPYRNETTVDFTNFNSPIFIITGETGAGKTMIFDAICFALYGKSSGEKRDQNMLVCDKSPDKAKSLVELTFQIHGKQYIVKRSFQRSKTPSVSLEEIGGDYYVSGVTNVNKAIESLLGLNFENFRMTIMIAQGKFEELIQAKPETRKAIFRQILSTHNINSFQEVLKNRVGELRTSIQKDESGALGTLLTFADEDNSFMQQFKGDGLDAGMVYEALEKRIIEQEARVEDLQNQEKKAKEELDEAINTLQKAKTSNERYASYIKDLEGMTKLENGKKEMDALAKSVEEREAIKAVKERKDAFDEASCRVKQRGDVLEAEKNKEPLLKQDSEAKLKNKIDIEGKNNPRIDKNKETVTKFEGNLEKLKSLENVQKDLENCQKDLKKNSEDLKASVDKLNILNVSIDDLEKETSSFKGEAQLVEINGKISLLKQRSQRLANVETSLKRIHLDKDDLAKKKAKLTNDLLIREAKSQEADRHFDNFIKSQAGILASNLEEGKPCPVCGALDHPHLASCDSSLSITQKDLDEEKAKLNAMEQQIKSDSEIISGLEARIKQAEEGILNTLQQEKPMEAIPEIDVFFKLIKEETEKALTEQTKAKSSVEESITKHKANVDSLGKAKAQKEKESENKSTLENRASALKTKFASLEETRDSLLSETKGMKESEIKELIERLNTESKELNKEIEKAREEAQKAEIAHKTLLTKIDSLSSAFNDAKDDVKKAREAYEKEASERTIALDIELPNVDKEKLQRDKKISQDFAKSYAVMKGIMEKHQENNDDSIKEHFDVESLEADKEAKDQSYQEIASTHAAVNANLTRNKDALSSAKDVLSRNKKKREEYAEISALCDAVSGKRSSTNKIDFETYCMLHTFDRVLRIASERLLKMSDSRYRFVRKDPSAHVNRGNRGLTIEIEDLYNGTTREATGLSGGETFEASLSLALSFSEAIQSNKGGIELNSMFIDEGFGTLDPSTNGRAVQVLQELSREKDSLVGIISHIELLESVIDSKLVVEKTPDGAKITQYP